MSDEMIKLSGATPIGEGCVRRCFVHPADPGRCVKITKPGKDGAHRRARRGWFGGFRAAAYYDETLCEMAEMRLLWRIGGKDVQKHLPRHFGLVKTDLGTGAVLERLQDFDGGQPPTLRDAILRGGICGEIKIALDEFCAFLRLNYLTRWDAYPANILCVRVAPGRIRLFVADGLGRHLTLAARMFAFERNRRAKKRAALFESRVAAYLRSYKNWRRRHARIRDNAGGHSSFAAAKRVAVFGAYFSSNVGDLAYRNVFGRYLRGVCAPPVFCRREDLPPADIDFGVIGGGGLIRPGKRPIGGALKRHGIPYAFVSVGVGLPPLSGAARRIGDAEIDNLVDELAQSGFDLDYIALSAWSGVLAGARLITVRSEMCRRIIALLVRGFASPPPIVHFPDAVYLLPQLADYRLAPEDAVVVIPNADLPGGDRRRAFMACLQAARDEIRRGERVIFAPFWKGDRRAARILRQAVRFTEWRRRPKPTDWRPLLSPLAAAALLHNAKRVYTARYHGLVIARACGFADSDIVNFARTYKATFEPTAIDIKNAERHFDFLRAAINESSPSQSR